MRPLPRRTAGFRLPEAYERWNRVLVDHCLLGGVDGGATIYLSITPAILSAALATEAGQSLGPDEAALSLAQAVSSAYQDAVLGQPEKLWSLASEGSDGIPRPVAFLALAVYAAYQMRSDVDSGPNAYYPRLAALLGCPMVAGHPRGFDPVDFGDLWEWLAGWIDRETGRQFALPGADPGLRRYVAYPLAHTPLRQVDIEKLPDFFYSQGLEPGDRTDTRSLSDAFRRWATARGILSRAGHEALSDDRRHAVNTQLELELEAWDGSFVDRLGRHTATVHVLLDVRRRQPQLSFLPRRPPSFPAVFDDGTHIFEGEDYGWYEPMPISPDEGPALEEGFVWKLAISGQRFSLSRGASTAIALRPAAEFTGFVSQRGLPLGIESAALCVASLETDARDYLSLVCEVRSEPLRHAAVPEGWRLFTGLTPRRTRTPPPGLVALTVESSATALYQGGLRLGRRAAWLAGAPPAVLFGGAANAPVAVDGIPATLRHGKLELGPLNVGQHIVEVAGLRRRLEIVEPEGRWSECAPLITHGGGRTPSPIALPKGRWAVIGTKPGELARATSLRQGVIVRPAFSPAWAVSVGSRRGATALCLTSPALPPDRAAACAAISAAAAAWVSVVYEAQIRRPRFASLDEAALSADLQTNWREYARIARGLKRRWRTRQ